MTFNINLEISKLLKKLNHSINSVFKLLWYTQIKIEMAACELEEGPLLIYTDKGVCIVNVPFDKDFWPHLREKLKTFFLEFVLPVLLS